MTPAVALSIAGSDSGGGAGVQADLNTFAAHGVHGTSALTAVTAQNTAAVLAVMALEPDMVVAQVEAVLSDMPVAAVKTGMLATAATVGAVARLADLGRLPALVVDPVLVASSGHALMEPDGVDAYRRLLLPRALVATPNLGEAAVLTGRPLGELDSIEAMVDAAQALRALGSGTVVVKGGHLSRPPGAGTHGEGPRHEGAASPDVVVGPAGTAVLDAPRVRTGNDHGTGCSLSAAIAANLALGAEVLDAIGQAKSYVRRGLLGAAGWRLGAGRGPIDHFGWGAPEPAG